MRRYPIILLAVASLTLAGCTSARQVRIANIQRKTYAMHRTRLSHVEFMQTYAVVSVSGAGSAELFIDGGKVACDRSELHVPVGTHEFRAVWPDGREASMKAYCPPALGEVLWRFTHTERRRSYEVKIHSPGPDLDARQRITRVELKRPN